MYIYKTTNLITGKVYIGKSAKQFNKKYLGSGTILMRAVKKYGKENFIVELIEQCICVEDLDLREIYWIKFYKSNSYNIAPGGTGGDILRDHPDRIEIYKKISKTNSVRMLGHLVAESTREILSVKHKKWNASLTDEKRLELNEKISKSLKKHYETNMHHSKGCHLTDEHKKKLSENGKLRGARVKSFYEHSPEKQIEIRNKLSNSLKGRIVTEETREKIRQSLLGRPCSEEKKEKIKQTFKKKYGKSI